MTRNEVLDKLMSKIKWRECVRDIVNSDIKFIVDYDVSNIIGHPSLFQLKVWVHEMFDLVYFYSKPNYRILSDNKYIEISKDNDCYYLRVGNYESTVKLTRSSL
jgi:hypothetical protein